VPISPSPPAANRPLDPAACGFVLVEDDTLLLELLGEGLRRRFSPKEMTLFGEGRPALDHCLAHPVDLLITDLRLPDIDGREIVRQLRGRHRTTRVIALTAEIDAALPAELIALGIAGYVDKQSPVEQIERAVRRVLAGGIYFSAGVGPQTAATVTTAAPRAGEVGPESLSERERMIVRLVAQGLSSKEIGGRLDLNVRLVEKERARVMAALQLRDLAGLIRWALRHGLG
jgi:DNA-binding NarL/FixJ family response regulator